MCACCLLHQQLASSACGPGPLFVLPPSRGTAGTMHDPHPLAIIPLQKDLLLSDTSSNSSGQSSPRTTDAPSVNVRSLVPRPGHPAAAGDSALMRSLISLLPHEQADSQVSAAVPPSCSLRCLLSTLGPSCVRRNG